MNFWLIQRGRFYKKPLDQITGIDSAICYDYMGSSEFEFGALNQTYKRIKNSIDAMNIIAISVNNSRFNVFIAENKNSQVNEIAMLFARLVANPYGALKKTH